VSVSYSEQMARICGEAVGRYGARAQLDQLQEECTELATAVSHERRGRAGSDHELAEEIADVTIMLCQARMLVPQGLIDAALKTKLLRLEARIRSTE
jgi:NTP pyrophosphatase (non-canonical NTP hydrolase)